MTIRHPFGAGHLQRAIIVLWFALLLCAAARPARASDPADLCRTAVATAASASGVPEEVLLAITLTETGRDLGSGLAPWPWAVNTGDAGHWFPDRESAVRFANDLVAAGRRSFDIGCFQINLRWHEQEFASMDDMFDPDTNALYAAQFLSDLARDGDGWSAAAGAYHSRTPDLALRYRRRFDQILADLGNAPQPAAATIDQGGYSHPLLQARDAPRTPGSLVPLAPVPAT
jgi:hypothetical protein